MNDKTLTVPAAIDYETELARDPSLRSAHTRTQYALQLRKFEEWRAGRTVGVALVEEYLARLQQKGLGPATVKQAAAAVRWMARRAVKHAWDQLPEDKARALEARVGRIADIPDPKMSDPEPAGRHITNEEIEKLLEHADDGTKQGARAVAFLAAIAGTGARNAEIRKLTMEDIAFIDDDTIQIRIVNGKGGKHRTVELFPPLSRHLARWIETRGVKKGYLFTRVYKDGRISEGHPLSYQATVQSMRHISQSAGVAGVTWHDLRRSLIGKLLDGNVDPSTIMDITGHASFETTKRYDRRPADRRQAVLKKTQGEISG